MIDNKVWHGKCWYDNEIAEVGWRVRSLKEITSCNWKLRILEVWFTWTSKLSGMITGIVGDSRIYLENKIYRKGEGETRWVVDD